MNVPILTQPLEETADPAPIAASVEQAASNDPVHRRLRAIAGADNGYLFFVIPKEPGGQVVLEFSGFYPEDVPAALRELATALSEDVG